MLESGDLLTEVGRSDRVMISPSLVKISFAGQLQQIELYHNTLPIFNLLDRANEICA